VLFSSPAFFLFFVVYFCLHLVVPAPHRVWLIVAGSTVFYAWWRIEYTWLPYILMATAYFGVQWMELSTNDAGRKRRAAIAIIVLFLPLLFFKYTNFVYRDVLGPFLGWHGTILNFPLPLGVSFVTFTLTAYVVDIYKRKFPGHQRPSTVLAYVLFFPHLIAGPILRPDELIPQIDRSQPAAIRRVAVPLAIFTLGLVKKLVFADQIAGTVDSIYAQGTAVTAPAALLAIYGFSAQIYCDFSGYTDMAIGLALLLGVRLPTNFLRPYTAHSIVDFWRRWHITLSYWLRDYLYIPLGGSRHGRARETRNVILTMALGGLWHGASWTFVIWGLLHGIGVAIVHSVHLVAGAARGLPRWLGVLITFHFVTIAWVFFRAPTVENALRMLHASIAGSGWADVNAFAAKNAFVLLLLGIFFIVHRFDDHRRVRLAARYVRPEVFWPVLILFWIIAITVSQGSSAKFIYFDF
jgi:alginate O-acetyltransferase complex protein AlgI